MSWIPPENKLDIEQREFLDNVDIKRGNVWIKGFPGSGKSVLLAYVYKKIRQKEPLSKVVVVVFTHSLIRMYETAFNEMNCKYVDIITYYQFMKNTSKRYDYVLVDEVQDLIPEVLESMNKRSQHVLVAGDSNQSIYETDPIYKKQTVSHSEIGQLLNSVDYELHIIHRLSRNIIEIVHRFLPRMNIFAAKRDMTKESTMVRLCEAFTKAEEIKYIIREAKKYINVGQTVGILLPTHDCILAFMQGVILSEGKSQWEEERDAYGINYQSLNSYLEVCGIPLQYVGNRFGAFNENSLKINVMTYHSSKGLDFDNVFLPFLNNNLSIVRDESLSKILFMVAMTRSRNNLYLTYNGYKHHYIQIFASECSTINIHDVLNVQQEIKGGSIFAGF